MSHRLARWWLLGSLFCTSCAVVGDPLFVDGPPSTIDATTMDAGPMPDGMLGCTEGSCEARACHTVTCTAGSCVYQAQADGTSCGADASSRCCGAVCVDVSSDVANCGGCGLTCSAGQICESVAVTASCDPHPAKSSGRCRSCTAGLQCPLGSNGGRQTCRTASPFTNYCSPATAGDCSAGQTLVDIQVCPNFCAYAPP
jgi:hypothetical protein